MNQPCLNADELQNIINNIEINNYSDTQNKNILHDLIENNKIEQISKLLKTEKYGINQLNKEGLSPLHISVMKNNYQIVKLLLESGANPNIKSLYKNQTPLHFAYLNKNDLIISELIKFNASENLTDCKGKKPKDYKIENIDNNSPINENQKFYDSIELPGNRSNTNSILKEENSNDNMNIIPDNNVLLKKLIINKREKMAPKKFSSCNITKSSSITIDSSKYKSGNNTISTKKKTISSFNINNHQKNSAKSRNENNIHYSKSESTKNQTINKNQMNTSLKNYNNKINEFNFFDENNDKNSKNLIHLKKWLENIKLNSYYNNFIDSGIYNIDLLINELKIYSKKIHYENLEEVLKIHKPGHIYRIICKLELDAGLIDNKIFNFMEKQFLITQSKENEIICCFKKTNVVKNELYLFLQKYNLIDLYPYFYHNGFELINFVLLQMYSSYPIDEEMLINDFHIYSENKRINLLKAIHYELNMMNKLIVKNENENTENYENNLLYQFDDEENENYEKQKKCNDCIIN